MRCRLENMKKPAPTPGPGRPVKKARPKTPAPTLQAQQKRAPGQPTKYKPEYCAGIIEYLADGHSLVSYAATIGVNVASFLNWEATHPEFFAAKSLALQLSQKWWETKAMENLVTHEGVKFSQSLWIFVVKNRFGYRDVREQEHSGPGGTPIQIAKLSATERDARHAEVKRLLAAHDRVAKPD